MEYRPVSLEEARDRLEERFEREQDRAFDYLEEAREEAPSEDEEREDFWTVNGRDTIDTRIERLIGEAEERVVYIATDDGLISDGTDERLRGLGDDGIDVWVMSRDERVRDRFEDADGVRCVETPEKAEREDDGGRFLMVDSDTVLLTVLGDGDGNGGGPTETAVWSSGTRFASVLVQVTEGWVSEHLSPASG